LWTGRFQLKTAREKKGGRGKCKKKGRLKTWGGERDKMFFQLKKGGDRVAMAKRREREKKCKKSRGRKVVTEHTKISPGERGDPSEPREGGWREQHHGGETLVHTRTLKKRDINKHTMNLGHGQIIGVRHQNQGEIRWIKGKEQKVEQGDLRGAKH